MFRSEIGSGFEDPGGTPPPRIPRSTPPPPPGSFRTQGGEPKEDSISCMRHNVPCQYQDGERFPQITKERRYLKMIKGVQAVKGELSGLDKQLSDSFLHEVSLILC